MHRELKTNGGMLPQFRPLESRVADNLQGTDETGPGIQPLCNSPEGRVLSMPKQNRNPLRR